METYFFHNFYSLSGCPKMEAALMEYTMKRILHHIVAEHDLGPLVDEVKARQEALRQQNRSWKPCEVKIWKNPFVAGDIRLRIGGSSLMAQRVKGYYQAK